MGGGSIGGDARLGQAGERLDHELSAIVSSIMARPEPVRLVAIDGHGGAGKTSFARQLSAAANGAPIVHTDEFAAVIDPVEWWPVMRDRLIAPLAAGTSGEALRGGRWHVVDPAPIVLIEGVSSARTDWSGQLAFIIWVETPAAIRTQRARARDGFNDPTLWNRAAEEERDHFSTHRTKQRADVIIDNR